MIRARFYVAETIRRAYNRDHLQVNLQAVTRGPENKVWAKATPSGNLTMVIQDGAASDWFEQRLGQDVVLTFSDSGDPEHYTGPHGA